ncbi:MAG: phosphoribosylformylglycinamidine synthase, partial [Clostridia bacterium]|nr:phosphoribosylformylglycinamidine synthase [Clostridia bacterium]
MIRRIFVEKKKGYDVEAKKVFADITNNLGIQGLTGVRLFCRYDVDGLSDEQYNQATNIVFSEPPVDDCYHEEMPAVDGKVFAIEFLPGQYDQRADSAMQCIQILTCGDRPKVKSAKVYVLEGNISDDAFDKIKGYMINPVEARQAALEKPETLDDKIDYPEDVKTIDNFITCSEDELVSLIKEYGLAMDEADIKFCREYFKTEEKRNPTLTEIRMIDTYWSDHCRHTTFGTVLDSVEIGAGTASDKIENSWNSYLDSRKFVYGDRHKDICLMDVATLAMKKLKKQG